jgi:hypothetical protein
MPYRDGDETVSLEAKVEVVTAKARLIKPTMGPEEAWLPKSQTVSMEPIDGDGNFLFVVTKWWADKNSIEE